MAEKNIAQKIEANLKSMLRDIDSKIGRLMDGFNELAGIAINDMEPPKVEADKTCNTNSGALPVSVALRAVDYGIARLALRVIPRMSEEFLERVVLKVVKQASGLVGAWIAVKIAGAKIPIIGDLVSIFVGYGHEKTYQDRFQKMIRSTLGCSPSDFDKAPMKYALNQRMQKTVLKDNTDARHMKRVSTRRP